MAYESTVHEAESAIPTQKGLQSNYAVILDEYGLIPDISRETLVSSLLMAGSPIDNI